MQRDGGVHNTVDGEIPIIRDLKMKNEWIFALPIEDDIGGKVAVPDTAKGITQKAQILAMDEKNGEVNLKIGDKILFRRNAAFKWIELEGMKLNVLKKEDVLGIVFGEDAVDVSPLKDKVFLEWEMATPNYGKTNLIRPESYREMHYTGIVVAVGPDVKDIQVGDRVFFDQFCGIEKFQENDKRFGFVRQDAIYCTGVPKRDEVAA